MRTTKEMEIMQGLVAGLVFFACCVQRNFGQTLATLQAQVAALPAPVAYYPFSQQFMAHDGSGNLRHGILSTNAPNSVTGPFGDPNTALEMGPVTASDRYITILGSHFNFGNSSWTMTLFVDAKANVGPILEYTQNTTYDAHLWQHSTVNDLYTNPMSGGTITLNSCDLSSGFQFIGWRFDHVTGKIGVYCDTTLLESATAIAPPVTNDRLLVGMRYSGGGLSSGSDFAYACLGIYPTLLNETQLTQTRTMCPLWNQVITCSAGCTPGTCWPDLSAPNGYVCASCLGGYTGSDCTPICSPSCVNGAVCSAPNTCSCLTGWTGSQCETPICTSSCTGGTVCVAPDTCSSSIGASQCNSIRSDINSADCVAWMEEGMCIKNPSFMWFSCQTSCSSYATCDCTVPIGTDLDFNCTCGDWATLGLCETADEMVQYNCNYTCNRRNDSSNFCTAVPLGMTLPANSHWTISTGPPAFVGITAYLQSAVVECNTGYSAANPSFTAMHICDPFTPNATTGNWFRLIHTEPTCLPIQCPDPPIIENSIQTNYTALGVFFYGDVVSYSCDSGFIMDETTKPNATCTLATNSGWAWVDNAPSCIYPPCQSTVDGVFAYYNVSANYTGGIAVYSCFFGYDPIVDQSYFVKTCQDDGSWLPVGQPQCAIVKCPSPPLEANAVHFGTKTTQYQFGDSVVVRCSTGAKSLFIEPGTESTPLGSVTIRCTETGLWSSDVLECLLVQCEAPPDFEISSYRIMNASSDLNTLLFNNVIAFECDWNQGFEPSQNQTNKIAYWRCNENSTWDKQDLQCSQSAFLSSFNRQTGGKEKVESSAAVATGTTVMAIMAMLIGMIVCLDYMTLARDLRRFRHNLNFFFKLVRDKDRSDELHRLRQRVRGSIAKEKYLKNVEEQKEANQLAAAGYGNEGDIGLVANPLADGSDQRPGTAGTSYQRPDHVDGAMDTPDDPDLLMTEAPERARSGRVRSARK